MYNLVYYDVSHNGNNKKIADGTKLLVEDLINLNLQVESLPDQVRQMIASLKIDKVDPLGIDHSSHWENLMSVIIFCLSGQIPLRQEVLRGRQIMMELPRNIRTRENAAQIAFSLLPYFLIGFKSHLENQFQSDSNIVADVATFITRLNATSDPEVLSFLCAHRGESPTEKHILVESVHLKKAKVALNITKGILSNDSWGKNLSIDWYQQGPTEWACLNMFPEMFLRYLTSGQVSHLLDLLGRHFIDLQEMMAIPDPNHIKTSLKELDPITLEVLSFLSKKYGASWRSIDFSSATVQKDNLIQIALDVTLPDVTRLMPFYSNPHVRQSYVDKKSSYIAMNIESSLDSDSQQSVLVENAIERFFENQLMHPTAKAVYETAFYYLWGVRSAKNKNEVAIGIDRDHSSFQYFAWKQGYGDGTNENISSIPLLYGRRTPENSKGSALKDYCLRQFWR